MTYNVFGGTLSLTQSINKAIVCMVNSLHTIHVELLLTNTDVHSQRWLSVLKELYVMLKLIGIFGVITVQHRQFRSNGAGWPRISGKRGRPTNHFSCQKTRLNDISYSIKIWTNFSSILSQCTRWTDRRTDRQTETDSFLLTKPPCINAAW